MKGSHLTHAYRPTPKNIEVTYGRFWKGSGNIKLEVEDVSYRNLLNSSRILNTYYSVYLGFESRERKSYEEVDNVRVILAPDGKKYLIVTELKSGKNMYLKNKARAQLEIRGSKAMRSSKIEIYRYSGDGYYRGDWKKVDEINMQEIDGIILEEVYYDNRGNYEVGAYKFIKLRGNAH